MENYFGYTTGSSVYDKRRHLNCVLNVFIFGFDQDVTSDILQKYSSNSRAETAQQLKFYIAMSFSNAAVRCLDYISDDLQLSVEEKNNIFGLIDIFNKEFRSPAGYSKQENQKLLVHMLLMTSFMNEELRNAIVVNAIGGIMKPFFDVNYIIKTFNTLISAIELHTTDLSILDKNTLSKIVNHTIKSI